MLYRGFAQQGFDVVAAFDRDPARIGRQLGGITVRDIAELPAVARDEQLDLGVIATPLRAAQEVADALVVAGVRGILNLAPRKLFVPAHVALRTVDMTVEFESLSFALANMAPRVRRRRPRA
jgi:redox-sensing transcriptional repressor